MFSQFYRDRGVPNSMKTKSYGKRSTFSNSTLFEMVDSDLTVALVLRQILDGKEEPQFRFANGQFFVRRAINIMLNDLHYIIEHKNTTDLKGFLAQKYYVTEVFDDDLKAFQHARVKDIWGHPLCLDRALFRLCKGDQAAAKDIWTLLSVNDETWLASNSVHNTYEPFLSENLYVADTQLRGYKPSKWEVQKYNLSEAKKIYRCSFDREAIIGALKRNGYKRDRLEIDLNNPSLFDQSDDGFALKSCLKEFYNKTDISSVVASKYLAMVIEST